MRKVASLLRLSDFIVPAALMRLVIIGPLTGPPQMTRDTQRGCRGCGCGCLDVGCVRRRLDCFEYADGDVAFRALPRGGRAW